MSDPITPEEGNPKLFVWVQIVTTVSVVAGLILVAWELQQSRTLAEAALVQTRLIEIAQDSTALYGERSADSLALACTNPDEMTHADRLVVHANFMNSMRRIYSAKRLLHDAGIDFDWRYIMQGQIRLIAQFESGRIWLQNRLGNTQWWGDAELTAAIDAEIPKAFSDIPRSCAAIFDLFES